ncbi:MAG: glycosyltransferase family 39 protein [Victivallaceae bacterium]|nr:glycosyltransferase family 39 protein [Victivallaceae bacterium]
MEQFLSNLNFGIIALPATLLMILSSIGFGYLSASWMFPEKLKKTLSFGLISFALGINIIGLLTLVAGALKILSPTFNWGVMGIGTSCFAFTYGRVVWPISANFARRNLIFSVMFVFGMFFLLGSALCFPYSWDEQSYQLAVPYRWLNTGTVQVFLDNPYSAFPSLPQFVFRFFIEIGGIMMPRLISLCIYGAAFLALYLLIKRASNKVTAAIIIFAMFISPVFLGMTRVIYAEPFILLNLVVIFLIPRSLKKNNVWILSGLLCGGAAAVKVTGASIALPVLIWLWFKERKTRLPISAFLYFGLAATVIALPFYLRPWLATGNPFYPFLSTIFGTTHADYQVDVFHHAMGDRYFGLKTLSSFILGPLLASVYDLYYHGTDALFDGIAMGWQFALMWGIIISGCWLGWRKNRCSRQELSGLLMLLAFYLFWFFSSQQTRFLMPSYFIAGWFAAKLLGQFPETLRNILLGIILFASLYSIHQPAFNNFKIAWRVAFAERNNQYFLKGTIRDPGYVEALAFLAEETPEDCTVMLFMERRGLYVPRRYLIAVPYFQSKYLNPLPQSADDLWREITETKVDYLLAGITRANPDHIADYDDDNAKILQQLLELRNAGLLEQQFEKGFFWIFRVKRNAAVKAQP